jgi:sugar lactone lactonase YvrE
MAVLQRLLDNVPNGLALNHDETTLYVAASA